MTLFKGQHRYAWFLLLLCFWPVLAVQAQTDISATTGDDLNPPTAGNCLTEYTGDNTTDFMSMDHTAVQQAINAASIGAIIKIAGTCAGVSNQDGGANETILITKDITLQGGYDALNWLAVSDPMTYPTVLDAQNNGRVVNNFGAHTATLDGLTLQNGTVANEGSGVFNRGTLTISNSTISNNATTGSNNNGGGIYNDGVELIISNSTISNNDADNGGGIYSVNGPVSISNSTINGNTAVTNIGGGIYFRNGPLTIINSTISDNTASGIGSGGGIFNDASALTIINSTLNGNTANIGGGIYSTGSPLIISNSTISGNFATGTFGAGGIRIISGTATITNATIASNSGLMGGNVRNSGTLTLRNTILDNPLGGGANCDGTITDGGHNISSDASCGFSDPDSLNSTNPMLDAAGLQNNGGPTQTIALQSTSQAINAGDNNFLNEATFGIDYNGDGDTSDTLTTDQRGSGFARIGDGTVDMGAYETPVCFVEYTGDNVTDFSSADHIAIQNAINAASAGATVKIAGTCAGTSDQDASFGNETVLITKDITLQGGYDPVAQDWTITPDPVTYPTVLDVQNVQLNGRVVDNRGGHTVTIAGLTLQNGSTSHGGGIYNNGTLTVSNSIIRNNRATGSNDGGGIHNAGGTLSINNTTFDSNIADDLGGGIYSNGGMVTISDSTFSGNDGDEGGGIYNDSGTLTISDNTFSGNSAQFGGGIHNTTGTLTISNSTLSSNSVTNLGGGIYSTGTITVTNSTLSGNSADNGGGIYSTSTTNITNSTLSGNSATGLNGGGGILIGFGSATITNSTIVNNTSAIGSNVRRFNGTLTLRNTIVANPVSGDNCSGAITDGGYNISSDNSCGFTATGSLNSTNPQLDAAGLQNNGGPTQTIALQSTSPAINAGDNSFLNEATFMLDYNGDGDTSDTIDTDQRDTGFPRITNGTVDIGAFEDQSVCFTEYTGDTMTDFASIDHSAVQQAINAATAGATVKIAGTCSGVGNQDANSDDETVLITKDITLQGGYDAAAPNWTGTPDPATYPTVLDATNSGRVVDNRGGHTVTIDGLTIENGFTTGEGGGITNSGPLTIRNSTISGNSASSLGGGIASTGALTISNSTISGNSTSDYGGGIGGGNTLTISNSTVSGNSASNGGGGIAGFGALTLTNSTIAGNISSGGSNVRRMSGTIILRNTILDNPLGGGNNCFGTITDGGRNISSDNSCGLSDPDSLNNTNPLLDAAGLQNNGGPTQTIALQSTSPAIDIARPWQCTYDHDNNGATPEQRLTFDQRGDVRHQGRGCDAGAYEYQEATITINEIDVDQSATVNGDTTEFIELYDGGVGNTPIDDLMLVFLDASPTQLYAALPSQTGMWTTDANGYFVICVNTSNASAYCDFNMQRPADWLRDEVGTLTMHPSTTVGPLTFSYPFPNGFDGYAYDTNSTGNALTPTVIPAPYGQVTENGDMGSTVDSIQRCPASISAISYDDTIDNNAPTPGSANDCAAPFTSEPQPQPEAPALLNEVQPLGPTEQTRVNGQVMFEWSHTSDADMYHLWLMKADPQYITDWQLDAATVCTDGVCRAELPTGVTLEHGHYIWMVRSYNEGMTQASHWSADAVFIIGDITADLDGDGTVTPLDVMRIINRVNTDDLTADIDGNGLVNEADVQAAFAQLGQTQ